MSTRAVNAAANRKLGQGARAQRSAHTSTTRTAPVPHASGVSATATSTLYRPGTMRDGPLSPARPASSFCVCVCVSREVEFTARYGLDNSHNEDVRPMPGEFEGKS